MALERCLSVSLKSNPTSHADLFDLRRVAPIDQDGHKVLIGDRFGRLAMLSTVDVNKQGLVLVPLGEVRRLEADCRLT